MRLTFARNALAALALTSTLASAAIYTVDPAHSTVGFKVKHMMISNVSGKFTDVAGTFDVTDGKFAALNGVIQAHSVNTDDKDRDKHLRGADFFDTDKHPVITFAFTKQEGDNVYGNLTIKGVTKPVVLTSKVSGEIKDPWGNLRTAFVLEGKINRKDFGLTWNKLLEAGGVAVDENVQLLIEAQGIRQ
ncbi:MAG: YceI family protein [Campylobacterales bacterium]|nr:YceI family protein [Campylobacterales bacterium]